MFICSRHGCGMAGIPQGTELAVSWGMLFCSTCPPNLPFPVREVAECINAFPTKYPGVFVGNGFIRSERFDNLRSSLKGIV